MTVLAVTPEVTSAHWWLVGFPLLFYGMVILMLAAGGRHDDERGPLRILLRRISTAIEDGSGMPAWAGAGILSGLLMLSLAALGLYWDVAWHIDLGRDDSLMTPSHTLIVVGLAGLGYSGLISIIFATAERADVGLRVLGLRVPWSAISLMALGFGGLAAFPLDALWHDAYGLDVTLWSPPHLQLVAGGSLATISLWLMIAEARPHSRPTPFGKLMHATVAGATLTGLSTFQGEFDFGVPQFQVLYLPLLIAAAAGFTLVMARLSMGPGGALMAVAGFLVLRLSLAVIVGWALEHTVPRFPLYLVAALAVEAVAWRLGTARPLRFAVAAGLVTATVGMFGETLWADLSGWYEPSASAGLLLKAAVLAPVVAVAAAVLGAGLARAFTRQAVPLGLLAVAGVALVVAFAYPLPRNVGDVDAVVRLRPAGDVATVEVELAPADAADGASAFGIVAWQGGGRISAELDEVAPGRYVSSRPVPITGSWKTVVGLQRGDEVMATPVYLPADPDIGAPEVPAVAERRGPFVRNTDLLLRETHPGPSWPAVVTYSGLAVIAAGWVALFALAVVRIAERPAPAAPPIPGLVPRDRVSQLT